MKAIMPKIKKEWIDQILIVDGNSKDGSYEYAVENGYEVIKQKKKGLRHAYIEGFPFVKGDIVITFSPDGNSIPELIPPLIDKIKEGYDMVIVSRYAENAKSDDDTLVTTFGNWLFTNTINLLHGSKYTDAMVMFRAYSTQLFYDLDLHLEKSYRIEKFFHTILGIEPLLSVRAAKRKLKCADIPGDEPPRLGGQRKLQIIRWGSGYMWQVLREVFFWK